MRMLRRRSASCCVTLALLALASAAAPAAAQPCPDNLTCSWVDCRRGAQGPPPALWGDLAPTDTDVLPSDRDNTDFDLIRGPYTEYKPLWLSLDVENGWVFAGIHLGLQIWDARDSLAGDPKLMAVAGGSQFPFWNGPVQDHVFFPVRGVDAPPGNDNIVAVAVINDIGLAVFDTTNKDRARPVYGDKGKDGRQVYAANIGGVDYAFLATTGGSGLLAYNLDIAAARTSSCVDDSPTSTSCGPYVGRLGTGRNFYYVAGTGNYLVASSGGGTTGLEIWNVSKPASPRLLSTALTADYVGGVAMWQAGSKTYLGMRVITGNTSDARIYDITKIVGGTSSSLGTPLWRLEVPTNGGIPTVTYSTAGGRHFLHFGTSTSCLEGMQAEWLYDVSTPSAPFDITPAPALVDGALTGYWGWYYRRNPTGFNGVGPNMGKFYGQYFYRAAYSIFDVHQLTGGVVPTAGFTYSPSTVYAGQPTSFTDTSGGRPDLWGWIFPDATPSSSTAQNPSGVVFNTPGTKTVSLTVTNDVGQDTTSQQIAVLDPAPGVASVSVVPNPALVCQPVQFTANAVTGYPAPALSWEIKDSGGLVVASGGDVNPFTWPTESALAGTYTATVTATNSAGSTTKDSSVLTLNALPPLPAAGSFTPTNDAFTNGTVQFHVAAQGATEWNWSFGDGTTTGWTNDPVAGPNPIHSYTAVGSYNVTVQVRNCRDLPVTSGTLTVNVTQITPLAANFAAQGCVFGFCTFTTGETINFSDASTGSPESYEYAWSNTSSSASSCSFSQSSATPVTSHIYTSAGTYYPCLRVTRGVETDVFVHPRIIIGTSQPPPDPRVTVGCSPTSATTGASISCSASVSDCSPTPTTFSWDVGSGGSITAGGTGSSITVSYSTPGGKTVRATAGNGGCTGTSGTRTLSITSPSGGASVNAAFTFTPGSPEAGQQILFDGGSSTGKPDSYGWDFGDGTRGNGQTVSHTYTSPGARQVTLEVTKIDPSCPDVFGIKLCTDQITKTVVVQTGGPPPPMASFDTSAVCEVTGFGEICNAAAGEKVTFTSTSKNATSFRWTFGDGGTATGAAVEYTWAQPGDFSVILFASNSEGTETSTSKLFQVTEPPTRTSTVILPFVAHTTGFLQQTSDLYLTNPGEEPMTVEITFRKRGLPENPPPSVLRTIASKATFYIPDVLTQLFGREDTGGFLVATAEDVMVDPVIVSLNRILQGDGVTYGQMVPGITLSRLDEVAASGSGIQYLLGLSDTAERNTTFGLTNPHPEPATYRLSFYDADGDAIGEVSEERAISGWGQKVFSIQELRDDFGLEGRQDYRVEIQQLSGSTLYGFAGVIRLGTQDPSFVRVSVPNLERIYLVGAASTAGFNNSFFQTDAVLSNPTDRPMIIDVTFQNVGLMVPAEDPETLVLLGNESLRISDVIFDQWGLNNNVGVLTFESDGAEVEAGKRLYPMIHGETYQNDGPGAQYGLFMPARRGDEAAKVGETLVVAGLRQQDGDANTTLWLFNPSDGPGHYDLVYYDLSGNELGRINDYVVAAGGIRQVNPSRHPLPSAGVEGGFTVEIQVEEGEVISGAQVVINQTNDPAYVAGVVR